MMRRHMFFIINWRIIIIYHKFYDEKSLIRRDVDIKLDFRFGHIQGYLKGLTGMNRVSIGCQGGNACSVLFGEYVKKHFQSR